MNFNFGALILITVLLMNVTACSYVKSLFPDKGKDYQYTTEIAPLNLPDDLKNKASAGTAAPKPPEISSQTGTTATEPSSANAAVSTAAENPVAVDNSTDAAPDAQVEEPAAPVIEAVEKSEKISVELIRFNDGENRLRLGVETPRAWRLVSKALSRKSIEVNDRNQAEGFFAVQYDPDEQKVEDGSLLDEAVFIFRGFQSNEKEYVLKLEELDRKTEVIILDKDQQPLSDDGAGLKLLTLLQNTINADLADNK